MQVHEGFNFTEQRIVSRGNFNYTGGYREEAVHQDGLLKKDNSKLRGEGGGEDQERGEKDKYGKPIIFLKPSKS